MSATTGLRAAFFQQMQKTLMRWSVDHSIKFMDGQFSKHTGFDGRIVHENQRCIYHFTPEQWNSQSNQDEVKRLEDLSKEILSYRAPGKRSNPFFMFPVVLKQVFQLTLAQKETYTSIQFDRLEVLENIMKIREHVRSDVERSRYSEMIGAIKAIRDPVLRGRRRIPSWQVYYRHSMDDHMKEIRRLRYGLVHIGLEIPNIYEPVLKLSRRDPAYKGDPIAAYTDDLTSTPWEFWMEDPMRLEEMKIS